MTSSRPTDAVAAELVLDTSAAVYLAAVGRLDLLDPARTLVPPAVVVELMRGPDDPARAAVAAGWGIRTSAPALPAEILQADLGAGESEVIALALRLVIRAVLDDNAARRVARDLGVSVVGSLGLVLEAVGDGRLPNAVPTIRAMRSAGLYLSDEVVREALARTTGETWEP
jgi:predicted nucleic acid-binding protein